MKRFKVIFFLGICFIMGCDPVYRLKTNGIRTYKIDAPCGQLQISSGGFTGSHIFFDIKSLKGTFEINTDSLHLLIEPDAFGYFETSFSQGRHMVNGRIKLEEGQRIRSTTTITIKDESKMPSSPILKVLPGAFLKCGATSLITDTIRITNK